MLGNISIRIFVAAAVIGLTIFGMSVIGKLTEAPPTVMPDWDIKDLPKQLGEWTGEDVKLDPRLFQATGAQSIVERQYHNESGMSIALHLAIFTDATEGIWHSPMHCYESAGWNSIKSFKEYLSEMDDQSDQIALCTWEKGGDNSLVGYWFQLGEHRLYSRFDLGTVRWQMRGRQTWPPLIKVLLSTEGGLKPEDTQVQMIKFAALVHGWLNQPQHQTKDESPAAETAASK